MSILAAIRKQIITNPATPRGAASWRRAGKFIWDLVRHCVNELQHDRAEQMAAALTYRTIFSIVPILVLSLLVFNALGGFKDASSKFQDQIFTYLGLSSFSVPADSGDAPPPPPPPPVDQQVEATTQPAAATQPMSEEKKAELRQNLTQYISEFTAKAQNIPIKAIGAVGLVLFIWGALSLAVSMEGAFNTIYSAPSGRPWHLRVMIYWSVITLGPVLLFVSLYVGSSLVEKVSLLSNPDRAPSNDVLRVFGAMLIQTLKLLVASTSLFASWLLLFLLYLLMPNTKVQWRPALIGSFIAASFWELGKWLFKLYIARAVTYNAIYGSLGLIPLFFLWLYVTWTIVLFGLELSYTLQVMKSGRFKYTVARSVGDHFYDPRWIIPMMGVIGRAFQEGAPITADKIAAELSLPVRVIVCLGEDLEKAGFVHRTQPRGEEDPGYTLAMPPEKINMSQLVDLSKAIADEEFVEQATRIERRALPGWAFLDDLIRTEQDKAAKATLATVIAKPEPGAAAT